MDLLTKLVEFPVPSILVILGAGFILLGLGGRIRGIIIKKENAKYAFIVGSIFVIGGGGLHLVTETGRQVPTQADLSPVTISWLNEDMFEDEAESQRNRGFYPVNLEGKSEDGANLYSAIFKPTPSKVADWAYYVGKLSDEEYRARRDLLARHYTRIWRDAFFDGTSAVRHQAVWIVTEQ